MANSRDTFDYQSYLAALGVEGSADDLSAEQKNYLYDHAIKQAYGAALKVAKSDPTLASKEEREDFALNTTFDIFPDAHSTFGLQKPSENPDDVLNLQTLKAFIEADPVKTENLDYYMDKMANRVIGRTTKYEFPYLKGVSKANFKKLFFEKSGIDEYTTVDEILKSNAKTLALSDAEGETVKRDSAAVHSVKQVTQNWARAVGLVGDQLGSKQISDWANQAVIKTEEDIKNGNYERTYGKSARETLLEEGFGALVGKVNEMLIENWASIAPSLGLVGVARFLPKTGRLGIARRILTGLGIFASAQELGAIRGEEEAKGVYDPEHPTSTLVAGLASASLDVIGNLNVVGSGVVNEAKALFTRGGATARNATRAELSRISAKRAEIAAMREADRNILQRTVRSALVEGVTETAQEHVAMGSAALKGATYGAMDVVDRSIDTFLVGAASGAGIHTVSEAGDKLTSRAEEKEFNERIIKGDNEGPLDVGPAAGFPKRTDIKGVNRDDLSPTDDGTDVIAGVSDKEATTLPHAKRKGGMYEWDSLTNAATGQEDSVVSIGRYIAEGSSDREAYLRLLATINDSQTKKTIDAKQIEHRNENDEASVKFSSGQTLTVRGDRSGRLIERIVALHNANDNAVVFHKSTTIDASKIEDQSDEGLLSYLERELYTYKGAGPSELVTDTAPAGAVSIPVMTDVPRQGASGTRASFLELVEVEETDDDGNVTKREELQDTRNIEQTLREQGYFVISPEQVSAKTRKSRGIGSRDIYAYKDGILYHARLHESNNSSALYATVDGYDVETGAQIKLDDRVARQEIRTAYAKPDANNQEGQGTVVAKSIYIGPPAEGIRVQRQMKGSKAWWQFNDDDIRRLRLSKIIDDEGRNDVNYRSLVTDNGALLSLYVTDSGKVILRNQRGRLLTKGNLTRFMDEMTDEIDARQGIEYVVGVLQGKSRQGYETISLPVESGVSDEIIFVYPRNQKDSAKRKIYAVWRTSGKTTGDKRPLHRVIEWSTEEDSFPARLERLFNATSLDDLRSVFGTNWIDARVVARVNTDGETEYVSAKSGNTGIYWTKDISKAKLFSNDTKLEDIKPGSEAATGELVSVHAILSQFNNDNSLVMFGEDTPFADILVKVKEYVHLLSPLGEPQGWTWTPSKKGFFSSVNESLLHPMGHSNDQVTTSVSTEDAVVSGQPELAVEAQTARIQNLEAAIREQMRLSKGAMSALSGVAKKVEVANQLSTPEEKAAALEEIADRMERNFYRNAVRIYAGVLGSRLDSNSELGQEVAEVMNDRNSTLEDMQNLVRKVEDLFNRSFPVTKPLPDVKDVDALVAMNARVSVLAGPLFSRNTRAARVRRAGTKGISLLKELLRARLMSDSRLASLLGSETLILVDTQEEAEELIAAAYGTAPFYSREGLIQGFVIPETGQVVLVGDGIKVGDAGAVLMHELGVHARRFGFSDEEFTGILNELKNRQNDDSEEGRQIREAIRRVQEGNRLNPNDRHFWEEVGAYVVEANAGNPTSIVSRIVSWIKKYLYKLGVIDADSLTNQDIVNFARGAVRTARRGDFDRNVSQAVSREAQVYGLARNLGVPIDELRKELDKLRQQQTVNDAETGISNVQYSVARDLFRIFSGDGELFPEERETNADIAHKLALEVESARKEYDEVLAKYRNTDLWLKAPNGKDSNLAPAQWVQVRTSSFKKWGGDWEKGNEKVSVILDRNGEPMQVYHGTGVLAGFAEFKQGKSPGFWSASTSDLSQNYAISLQSSDSFQNTSMQRALSMPARTKEEFVEKFVAMQLAAEKELDVYSSGPVSNMVQRSELIDKWRKFATDYVSNYEQDSEFNWVMLDSETGKVVLRYRNLNDLLFDLVPDSYVNFGQVYSLFVKMENPLIVDAEGHRWNDIQGHKADWWVHKAFADGHDGVIMPQTNYSRDIAGTELADVYVVKASGQYKSATENEGTFKSDVSNILFSFAGERGAAALDNAEAATTRLDNLVVAREMEAVNKSVSLIKLATGWERGKDGKWRYELDDSVITVRTNEAIHALAQIVPVALRKIIHAPELFAAYPELQQMRFTYRADDDSRVAGTYFGPKRGIHLRDDLLKKPEKAKRVLMHEIQHALQDIEGFANGGSTEEAPVNVNREKARENAPGPWLKLMTDKSILTGYLKERGISVKANGDFSRKVRIDKYKASSINRLVKLINRLFAVKTPYYDEKQHGRRDIYRKLYNVGWDHFYDYVRRNVPEFKGMDKTAFDAQWGVVRSVREEYEQEVAAIKWYKSIAGETEARNVETRLDMTAPERRESAAYQTEDIARDEQHILEKELQGFVQLFSAHQELRSRSDLMVDFVQTPSFKAWYGDWDTDSSLSPPTVQQAEDGNLVMKNNKGEFKVFDEATPKFSMAISNKPVQYEEMDSDSARPGSNITHIVPKESAIPKKLRDKGVVFYSPETASNFSTRFDRLRRYGFVYASLNDKVSKTDELQNMVMRRQQAMLPGTTSADFALGRFINDTFVIDYLSVDREHMSEYMFMHEMAENGVPFVTALAYDEEIDLNEVNKPGLFGFNMSYIGQQYTSRLSRKDKHFYILAENNTPQADIDLYVQQLRSRSDFVEREVAEESSVEPVPWYSSLAELIGEQHRSLPAAKWLSRLAQWGNESKNRGESSPFNQEVYWTGVREWLEIKDPNDIVEPAELYDFLVTNNVEFKNITLGGPRSKSGREVRENLPLDNTDWNVRIREHDGVRYVFAGIDKDLFADQSVARALLSGLSISSASTKGKSVALFINGENIAELLNDRAAQTYLKELLDSTFASTDDYQTDNLISGQWRKKFKNYREAISYFNDWFNQNIYNNPELTHFISDTASHWPTYYSGAVMGGNRTDYAELLIYQNKKKSAAEYPSDFVLDPRHWHKSTTEGGLYYTLSDSALMGTPMHIDYTEKDNKYVLAIEIFPSDDIDFLTDNDLYSVSDTSEGKFAKCTTDTLKEALKRASDFIIEQDANEQLIADEFNQGHFPKEGKDLVAHTRFDTRETTDGKRILFIEEVQSDWANDLLFGKLRPEAPYVKYQKAWVTMVAKQVIAHAVEQGDIDGISWTSAEDQSNRWRTMGKRRLEVYQKTLPKAMQSILSDHVPGAKLEDVDIQDIGVRQALMLNDEVRNSVQSKGFPLFSIQDTGRSSDETVEGQQVQGAPGIYNRKGGGFAMRYDETVPGHERESLVYGAVLMTDNAKDTELLRALQTSLEADKDLLDSTVGMLVRESQNGESFDRKGIFASMMREVIFEGEENPHFSEVRDALYDAAGLALHVAPSSLSLTDAELLSVANAIGALENNVSEIDVAHPVPPPPAGPSRNELLDEAIQAGIEENDSVVPEHNADGTASVRTESGNVEYVFEDVNGKDENFRAALDSLGELTTDYDDGTLFSTNDDGTVRKIPGLTTPEELEAFLQKILPPEIYEQIEIHWEETRTAKAILRNAFGLFFPYRATDKPIHIRAWDRSIPQVLATVMHECSHYGWTMWGSKALDAEIVRIYNAYTETIYAELPQYFEMLGISDPYLVPDKWKVYLVNEFFAHVNASLMDDSPHIANAFHISDEEYKAMRERIKGVMAEIERKIGDSLLVNIGDRTAIDKFAKDLIALTMGTVVGRGARLIQNTLQSPTGARAPLSKIQIITNDYGQTRRTVPQTREALQVAETREVIRKWGRFFPKGDVIAEFILNNFPMHNRLKGWGFFPSLNVEHAVLGESVGTAYASRLIGNFWNKVSETVASKQRKRFLDLLDLKSALLDAHFDPNLIGSRGNETFAQVFERLGFAPDSAMMQKARLADATALELSSMKYRNALDIRRAIRGQALELEKRMRIAKIDERTIGRMRKSMAQFESRFHADWDHRMYNVFNGETGVRDLQRLLSYLETDTGTGEMTVNERARDAERIIEAATQQEQAGLITYKQFLSSTRDARTVLKDKERLDALKHYFELRTSGAVKTRAGSDWRTMLLRNMRAEIKQLIMEASRSNNNNGYGEDHLNRISAVRGRTLEDTEEDNFYRTFLDPNTNFFESLLYSVDQQEKILQKLTFNQEMAEHILDTGMGVLRQSTEYDRSYSDSLSWAEDGSILKYVAVDPIFQHALDNEYEVNRNVREAAWSGAIDSMKANSTIYSLRLAVSNHIGSLGILMSSGHLFRIGMMKKAGHVSWKQFADKMLLNSKDLSEAENKFLQMMYKYHIWGATTSDTMMQIRNKGWHEKAVHAIFSYLRDLNVVSNMSQNGLENIVKNALDKMRQFYAFGDEWLKPWVFMNNYNNMLAKHKALTPGLREEQYERLAGKDAAEMTLQETTSWEYTPKLIRHMSMNSIRMITPDFLMHNFQMARITAAIYTRFFDVMEELGKVSAREDVNEPAMKEYKDALTKEAVQRGIGVGLTTATYYGLFGAAKGVIAYLPYALGTMLGAIKLDDDDDERKKRRARSFFYPSEYHGATRITNWLNGGNNLFLPVMRDHDDPYSFFGYNYARNNVMLTHAPIMAATEDPTFEQRIIEAMKNFMDLSQGTMTQELVNNLMGKDKFGREISPTEAATAIGKRMMVPGVMTQILQATVGLPSTDTDFRKGRAIKVPQLAGITVNKYDVRDVTNHLAYFIREQGSLSKNVKKRAFVDDLSKGQPLPARDIAERIAKLREKNREDLNKAVYLLKGIRDFGLSEKEIHKYLTTSRKNAATLVGKDNAMAFLKGQNIFDIMLLNSLEEKKRNLLKSVPTSRMDKESIDIAIANTDRAIKLMRQSLRISAE